MLLFCAENSVRLSPWGLEEAENVSSVYSTAVRLRPPDPGEVLGSI